MEKLVELQQVTAGYADEVVLRNINLTVHAHDFVGVIGPNGGGKTTLVNVILGIIKPMSGNIIFHPDSHDKRRRFIGYLPQVSRTDKKFPIGVSDVVLSGLATGHRFMNHYSASDNERVQQVLAQMGIEHLAGKNIGELSGGQLQRVFLCRAIIAQPRLLILDEPNTFVDNKFESDLYLILRELNKTMAILMVSHDVGTITYYVKSIACVNRSLHYHNSNIISQEQLASYNCPIQIITHGDVPHTVLRTHQH
jgi:zinc transport system ATP-binding protein